MMSDGIPTEATSQPNESIGTVVEPSSQAPPVIPFPQPAVGSQNAEQAHAPERSLKYIYEGHAARYRELGQKQLEGSLSAEEVKERGDLEKMAGFGLFAADLSEDQLKVKDAAYQVGLEAEAKELENPQASAERYRALGKKLIDSGLMPDELAEYNRLKAYADGGKFELPQAA